MMYSGDQDYGDEITSHVVPEEFEEDAVCFVCSGVLVLLGRLGCLLWYRCRNCGMECSHNA
jgi:hypothetical protein